MPPAIPPLVFLSGLKGMLSGPITQEAGIAQTRARSEEEEQEEEEGRGRQWRTWNEETVTRREDRVVWRCGRGLRLEIKMHGEKVERNYAPNAISNVRLSLHTGKESDRCRGFVSFYARWGA